MTNTVQPTVESRSPRPGGGDFLCFRLSKESYALPIDDVREVIGMVDVTPVPRAPHSVLGVASLHGRIVPVVDLRARLGIAAAAPTDETAMVVVGRGDDQASAACVVDAVGDVVAIAPGHLAPAPRCNVASGDCIAGLLKLDGRVLIVLRAARLLRDLDPAAAGTGD